MDLLLVNGTVLISLAKHSRGGPNCFILCETQDGRAGIKVFNDSCFHVTYIYDKSIGNSCGNRYFGKVFMLGVLPVRRR